MIIGQRGIGYCTLAVDARRRDHVTQDIRNVKKLHKLSDQIIVAQGGAGSGAADDIVSELKLRTAGALNDIVSCIEIVREAAPSIMEDAASRWRANGLQIPPTQLIFASVDHISGIGVHVAIRLNDLSVTQFNESGPYFTGSNTLLIQEKASEEWFRLMDADDTSMAYDNYAIAVAQHLEHVDPMNIGLPVDVGVVRLNQCDFECVIRENLSQANDPDPRFLLAL
jgi:hypothetical protein